MEGSKLCSAFVNSVHECEYGREGRTLLHAATRFVSSRLSFRQHLPICIRLLHLMLSHADTEYWVER